MEVISCHKKFSSEFPHFNFNPSINLFRFVKRLKRIFPHGDFSLTCFNNFLLNISIPMAFTFLPTLCLLIQFHFRQSLESILNLLHQYSKCPSFRDLKKWNLRIWIGETSPVHSGIWTYDPLIMMLILNCCATMAATSGESERPK